MAKAQINPTRMELLKLKNKLAMSKRGHKLLKDKQDELIQKYIALVFQTKELREEVDSSFEKVLSLYKIIKEKKAMVDIYEMLMIPSSKINISFKFDNVMSISLPKIAYSIDEDNKNQTYSDITSPIEIDFVKGKMNELLPKIVKLSELEQTVFLMTDEIAKTRRRVNVIENVMIPELTENIKSITMKLEDNERSNTVRIMKSKEIVLEKIDKERNKRNKNK